MRGETGVAASRRADRGRGRGYVNYASLLLMSESARGGVTWRSGREASASTAAPGERDGPPWTPETSPSVPPAPVHPGCDPTSTPKHRGAAVPAVPAARPARGPPPGAAVSPSTGGLQRAGVGGAAHGVSRCH